MAAAASVTDYMWTDRQHHSPWRSPADPIERIAHAAIQVQSVLRQESWRRNQSWQQRRILWIHRDNPEAPSHKIYCADKLWYRQSECTDHSGIQRFDTGNHAKSLVPPTSAAKSKPREDPNWFRNSLTKVVETWYRLPKVWRKLWHSAFSQVQSAEKLRTGQAADWIPYLRRHQSLPRICTIWTPDSPDPPWSARSS